MYPIAVLMALGGAAFGVASGFLIRNIVTKSMRIAWIAASGLLHSGALFAIASRVSDVPTLVAGTIFAITGIPLMIIDIVSYRLPNTLVGTSGALVLATYTTATILGEPITSLIRAVLAMIAVATIYLILSLSSGGGLGGGDIKTAALIGLFLGWTGWLAVLHANIIVWLTAGLTWLTLTLLHRAPRNRILPMGPFLVTGAFAALLITAR